MLKKITFSIHFIFLTLFLLSCTQTVQNSKSNVSNIKKSGFGDENFIPLFNGENFDGWEGNLDFFRIEDGIIKAGNLESGIPRNEFLATTREYDNFELRLQVKTTTGEIRPYGYENGGIQFRSQRVPNHNEVSGYQADVGFELNYHKGVSELGYSEEEFPISIWGGLYDESRRNVMFGVGNQDSLKKVMDPKAWTDYVIRCKNDRIQIWINGFKTIDFIEKDDSIEKTGIIALQIHGSLEPSEIWYKNIYIKNLNNSHIDDIEKFPSKTSENLKVYPGLEATLFASEPMMLSPTNLDIDDKGRVWVCEVVNYRAHAENDKRPKGDRILILEDLDGDGMADKSKVFYQGRDIDAALGLTVLGNKVIVSAAPNVIVFTDENGDDIPDKKEYLFTKSGKYQDDHSIHSFVFGPDGKLYWNAGNNGLYFHDKNGDQVYDKRGNAVFTHNASRWFDEYKGKNTKYMGGLVFRLDMDGSNFEVLAHNFRNNYEMTIDSYGNIWQSDNDDDGNAACRINYIMEFGNYGYQDEMTGAGWGSYRIGWNENISKRHWHQNDPGSIPNVIYTGPGSPAGITHYEGKLLPSVFWNKPIHCDAGPGIVWSVQSEKKGAGYEGELLNIIEATSDKWIRPVDVAVAPDGSIFVTDWYDPVVGWNRQEDTARGRIFRIAPPNSKYKVEKFDYSSVEGSIDALKNPNFSVRYNAWTALNDFENSSEKDLLKVFRESNDQVFRARALWLLSKLKDSGIEHIKEGLLDENEDIRITSLRAARQLDVDMLEILNLIKDDKSLQVSREALIALSELKPTSESAKIWSYLAKKYDGKDKWYLEALGIAADPNWDINIDFWLKEVGSNWKNDTGKNIVWRSRSEKTSKLLSEIIVDTKSFNDSKKFIRAFDFQKDTKAKNEALSNLIFNVDINNEKSRLVALEALLKIKDKQIFDSDNKIINELLSSSVGSDQFLGIIINYSLDEYSNEIINFIHKSSNNSLNNLAINTLYKFDKFELIKNELLNKNSKEAISIAKAVGLSREKKMIPIMVDVLNSNNIEIRVGEEITRALMQTKTGAEELLNMSMNENLRDNYKVIAGQVMANSMDGVTLDLENNYEFKKLAEEYFIFPPMKNNESLPTMGDLLVFKGDPENGKKVFSNSTCAQCHVVNDEGVNYGPNLSKIGDKLSKRGLYLAILDPSAGISPTYVQQYFELEDGRDVIGYVLSETDNSIDVKSAGGIINNINKEDISSRMELDYSIMPNNLQQQMSVNEFVDLVEYMASLK